MSKILLFVLAITLSIGLFSQTNQNKTKLPSAEHGSKGFRFTDSTGNYQLNLEYRLQLRYSAPNHADPIEDDNWDNEMFYLGIRRARMKAGGHAYSTKLKYYFEFEIKSAILLDARIMYQPTPWLNIKAGQWKAQYNSERVISSGKQQVVDRSLINRYFTIDRQQGISLYGNLAGNGAANFSYWASAFNGTGRGVNENDDSNYMYMGRLQWNPNGKVLKFTGSDLKHHNRLLTRIAIAGVTNTSAYTRFSGGGGGNLYGFTDTVPGRYRVNQAMIETALKYKGFSWQQEFHYKQINDLVDKETYDLTGYYVQAGYFLKGLSGKIPKNLEVFSRYAALYPDRFRTQYLSEELVFGANYFLHGHKFKFTGDVSYIESNFETDGYNNGMRYRIQLDISL